MRLVLWSPLMSVTPNLDPSIAASSQVAHGMDASAAASIHSFPFLSYPTLDRKMNHSPPHSSSLSLSLSPVSVSFVGVKLHLGRGRAGGCLPSLVWEEIGSVSVGRST